MLRTVLLLICLSLITFAAYAQTNDCPAIVQTALETVDYVCSTTGRNQACYGNFVLQATAQEQIADFGFDAPGDIEDVTNIKTLTLNPMEVGKNEWGIAVMKLQANLPDTLPGQNVTILLFGDVEIENAVKNDSASSTDDATQFNPMQAFYFRSSVGDAPCSEAPNSGILIQTPEGAKSVLLSVNDVTIQLGSTAFLQAREGDALAVSVIEGSALVTAQDETRYVPAGARVHVPLTDDLKADGVPQELQTYPEAGVQSLPIGLLEREFEVARPLTDEEIAAVGDANPTGGTWQSLSVERKADDCTTDFGSPDPLTVALEVQEEGASIRVIDYGRLEGINWDFAQTVPNTYSGEGMYDGESLGKFVFRFASPGRLEVEADYVSAGMCDFAILELAAE